MKFWPAFVSHYVMTLTSLYLLRSVRAIFIDVLTFDTTIRNF